jgi:hypothetical protein
MTDIRAMSRNSSMKLTPGLASGISGIIRHKKAIKLQSIDGFLGNCL